LRRGKRKREKGKGKGKKEQGKASFFLISLFPSWEGLGVGYSLLFFQ
jgi:hypothetical protein